MKAKKALRTALEQPWLYSPEELTKLREKLEDLEEEGVQELWHRRTTMGFSNKPKELLQEEERRKKLREEKQADEIHGTFESMEDLQNQIGKAQLDL